MKVILSRKSFDSTSGGIASPILGDELLPMPIPVVNEPLAQNNVLYADLQYNDMTYAELLAQLAPNNTYTRCHLDPDLFCENRPRPNGWRPAFGQVPPAQRILQKHNVTVGDLFLFFGWFRKVKIDDSGYHFVPYYEGEFYDHADLHVVYAYLEVGEVITDPEEIKKRYPWHPHSAPTYLDRAANTLYIPKEESSLLPGKRGYGRLSYRKDRVLTDVGRSRGIWKEQPFFADGNLLTKKKNSAKNGGVYYKGRWQELVLQESDELLTWVRMILGEENG